jgi:hypothetical protein
LKYLLYLVDLYQKKKAIANNQEFMWHEVPFRKLSEELPFELYLGRLDTPHFDRLNAAHFGTSTGSAQRRLTSINSAHCNAGFPNRGLLL